METNCEQKKVAQEIEQEIVEEVVEEVMVEEIKDTKLANKRVQEHREKTEIIKMIGITAEDSGNYFIKLIEKRNRIVERESNIAHNPEIFYTCLTEAMNGLEFDCLQTLEVKRLILGVFYYDNK